MYEEEQLKFEYYDQQKFDVDLNTVLLDPLAIEVLQSYVQLFENNEIAKLPIMLLQAPSFHDGLQCCKAMCNSLHSDLIVISMLQLVNYTNPAQAVQSIFEQIKKDLDMIKELEASEEDEEQHMITVLFTEVEQLYFTSDPAVLLALKKLHDKILFERKLNRTLNIIFSLSASSLTALLTYNDTAESAVVNFIRDYLPLEEQITIELPNEQVRRTMIQQTVDMIYKPEEKIPSLEELVQLTEGFSSYRLQYFLDRLLLRSKTNTLNLSNFEDFLQSERRYIGLKSRSSTKVSSDGIFSLPLTRRVMWNDYKDHITEYMNNEPTTYPELLQAVKQLSNIDYKLRILLYDLSLGGVLAEENPYLKLTELKRILEDT